MSYDIIRKLDYVLIAIGILLIPAFGFGLILIGVAAWRIGTRMESMSKHGDHVYVDPPSESEEQKLPSENLIEKDQKTYNLEDYSIDILEDGR